MDCIFDVKFEISLPSNISKKFFLLFKQFMVLLVTFVFKFKMNFEVFFLHDMWKLGWKFPPLPAPINVQLL